MAHKQIVNGIRVYSRHSSGCNRNPAYVKCDCPKWIQYQTGSKKARRQVREPASTRSFERAVEFAQKKADELAGKRPPTVDQITVEDAAEKWLAHRTQQGLDNKKARLMSERLKTFCNDNDITFLAGITRAHLNDLKLSLKFKSGNSNSLKVHLSVLGGFFRWAVEEQGCLAANPFPRFRIEFKQEKIRVPTTLEINRVLMVEKTRVFASLMRYSGMAIQDAATLKRSALVGNLITGNRLKTDEAFRVRIPTWLADELRALAGGKYFFWDGEIQSESAAENYRLLLRDTFKQAGVSMTPHSFRHFFISSTLATGVSVEDVSHMVGTSPNEIRKTYRHWIKEATDRLDRVQEQAWLSQGLDRHGNPV